MRTATVVRVINGSDEVETQPTTPCPPAREREREREREGGEREREGCRPSSLADKDGARSLLFLLRCQPRGATHAER